MDILTAIVIIAVSLIAVMPATVVLKSYLNKKAAMAQKMYNVRAQKHREPSAKHREFPAAVPEWIPNLLEEFGLDADEILDSDEMPAELEAVLPLIKGFVDGGGLRKLLGGVQTEPEKRPGFEQGY